jgi:hypothetical protein
MQCHFMTSSQCCVGTKTLLNTSNYSPTDTAAHLHTVGPNQVLTTSTTNCHSFKTSKTFLWIGIFVIKYQIHRKLKTHTHQWQVGGTSFVSSSNDFSDLYSWTKATVTTIMIAWKEMVSCHQVQYTATQPLTVPSYASQALWQNRNKPRTVRYSTSHTLEIQHCQPQVWPHIHRLCPQCQ